MGEGGKGASWGAGAGVGENAAQFSNTWCRTVAEPVWPSGMAGK